MEANACIVNELLSGKGNYEKWRVTMKAYLRGRDLWHEDLSDQKDAMVLHIILISCEPKPFSIIKNISSGRQAWSVLEAEYRGGAEKKTEIENEPKKTPTVGSEDPYWSSFQAVLEIETKKTPMVGPEHPYWSFFQAFRCGDLETEQRLRLPENRIYFARLLRECIHSKHFDTALSLVDRVPELAITGKYPERSPLGALASSRVPAYASLSFWRRWIYKCIHISNKDIRNISVEIKNLEDNQYDTEHFNGDMDILCFARKHRSSLLRKLVSVPLRLLETHMKSIYRLKLVHVRIREILKVMCTVVESTSDPKKLEDAGLRRSMTRAAYLGNVEFITGIAKANPKVAWSPEISSKVIEVGIETRQPKVFNLVYGLCNKVDLVSDGDADKSTMSHKAAIIASPTLLSRIPGAALQMQRELQWFKEVQEIACYDVKTLVTTDNPFSTANKKEYLTPQEIFTRSHKDLVTEGERWMKDTASSCTVVGALIITLTFAAAFTFPGGYEQTYGYPMFIDKNLFTIFTISNAVALSASTTSVLMFLGILTSRYAEEDFLESLPNKLIIGLSTLFFSIAGMLTAFCAGLSVMYHQELWIVLLSALLSSIPVALFAVIQIPLFFVIIKSTYRPNIFNKNTQRWI